MSRWFLSKVHEHRRTLAPVIWGPILGMAGMALGTRLVTEVTPTAVYGETRLVLGVGALATGTVVRPFIQFAMREYHDARQANRDTAFVLFVRRRGLALAAILGLVAAAGLLTAAALGAELTWFAALTVAPMLVTETALSADLSLATTQNRQRLVSVVETARQWGLPLAAGAAMLLTTSAAGFILSQVAVTAAAYFGARHLLRETTTVPPAPAESASWMREARKFILPMAASGVFNWLLSLGDRYLLAYYCTPGEVGRYAVVSALVSAPIGAAGGILARAAYPYVFRHAARQDAASEGRVLSLMLLIGGAIGAVGVVGVVLFGPFALRLLVAPEYRIGSDAILVWVAAGQACLIASFALDMRAYARKRTVAITLAMGLSAVVNLALNVLLIPSRRAEGAAIAMFAGYLVYLTTIIVALRRMGWSPDKPQRTEPQRPLSSEPSGSPSADATSSVSPDS